MIFLHNIFINAVILQVHFVGEEGIDTGGLSREFWRLLCEAIVKDYCIGMQGNLCSSEMFLLYRYVMNAIIVFHEMEYNCSRVKISN